MQRNTFPNVRLIINNMLENKLLPAEQIYTDATELNPYSAELSTLHIWYSCLGWEGKNNNNILWQSLLFLHP